MEKEIHKLNEIVEQLSSKVTELEKQQVWKESESSGETEEGQEKERKVVEMEKEIHKLNETVEQLSSKVAGLASNDYVVGKCDEFKEDYDTLMTIYSKLDTQVEELDKIVNKKVKMEDDLEILKEQVDRLDAYVYTSKPVPAKEDELEEILKDKEPLQEDEKDPQFAIGKVEKPAKVDRKTYFAPLVKNWMSMPEEKRAEIRQEPASSETKKVTMKDVYEKHMRARQETHNAKEEGAAKFEPKDTKQAEKIDIAELQGQEEIPTDELIIQEEEADAPNKGTVQKKFHKVAKAITLLQDMHRTQREGRLNKAKEMEALRDFRRREDEEDEQQKLSAESFEILSPPYQQVSIEHSKSAPGKATLLSGESSKDLKERIILYIKYRLGEMETHFMDKMHMAETSVIELQHENEVLRVSLDDLKSRLSVAETSQNKFERKLTAVEAKAVLNNHNIEEMMIAIDKKADRSDVMQGMTKKDMSVLEDRMLKIYQKALVDIEELRSFLKDYTVKLREELDEKVSGFDMDCRLEPLAGRLKKLEKILKDVSLKAQVLECQMNRPVGVKRYAHCEDGKRIKPLSGPISNWTSATTHSMPIHDDTFFDGENAEKIEADVRKRMEDVISRTSKRFIGGAHTKTKVAKSNK